eukprot:SRR837773.7487.p3 GENE.SRR837773.7487~~SRR837773.7487.p3  ORF type:complete len:103 (-),score=9.02 SRR837773.7487:91-399(-)
MEAWPVEAQAAVLEAVAAVAPERTTVVGPAPAVEAVNLLRERGFGQLNVVNHHQLRKIYGPWVPDGTAMLVAMRGQQERPGPQPAAQGGDQGGSSRAKELEL